MAATATQTEQDLRDEAEQAIEAARQLTDEAIQAERDLTDEERKRVEDLLLRAEGLNAKRQRLTAGKTNAAATQQAKTSGFGASIQDITAILGGNAPATKATRWGAAVIKACSDGVQFKGLTPSGAVLVNVPAPEPIALGRPAGSLRSLIPASPTDGVYAYLRMDERENNAAPVAPGALKPTSRYVFTRVQDTAKTIAHLSEPIPKQDLADAPLLQEFITAEMGWGLEMALEAQIISGDGTGENFTGLAHTAGVQTVPMVTPASDYSLLVSLRRGLTRLENQGLTGTGWIMAPSDWESIEIAATDDGALLLNGAGQTVPIDRAARRLYGLPVVSTPSCPPGVAWLADFVGSTRLYVREEAVLSWSENVFDPNALGAGVGASDFQRNLIRLRVEGRFGFAVTRPSGVVKIALA